MRTLIIKTYLTFILAMIIAFSAIGQFSPLAKRRAVCSYNCSNNFDDLDKCFSKDNLLAFTSVNSSHVNPYTIFDELVKSIREIPHNDFNMNFFFAQCDIVCSAAATIDQQSRQVIYYNTIYLDQFKSDTTNLKWLIYAIFAHEIGHQLMGHTRLDYSTLTTRQRRINELRADFFSGYVLRDVQGCTLERAMAGLNSLDRFAYIPTNNEDEKDAIYPTLEHRKQAIEAGFIKNPDDTNTIQIFHDIRTAAIKSGITIILDIIDRNLFADQPEKIEEKLDDYVKSNPDVDKDIVANLRGIIKALQNKQKAANRNFKQAIKENSNNLDYLQNSLLVEPSETKKQDIQKKINELQKQQGIQ